MDALRRWTGALAGAIGTAVDGLARFGVLAVLSVLVLVVIACWLNPAKIGSYLWVVSKLTMAAIIGEGVYRAMSRRRPESSDALERSMAQTQRATLMAACIIAAGLMP